MLRMHARLPNFLGAKSGNLVKSWGLKNGKRKVGEKAKIRVGKFH